MTHNPFPTFFAIPNPPVPFSLAIPNGMKAGRRFHVRGTITPGSQQFRVDLKTASGDTAFHLNPRFTQGQIVRNTKQGSWGPEERHGPFPFRHNESFEIAIQAESDHFKVAINGSHAFDYNHRLPLYDITTISLDGQFQCNELVFFGGLPPIASEFLEPGVPSAVPVSGIRPGTLIQVEGNIPDYARRFQINLQSGPGVEPGDIGFHFNPRWDDPYSPQPIIIRTNRQGGGWATEDRSPTPFPFIRGESFVVLFLCDGADWKVAVNGQIIASYPHQFDINQIDHVGIAGDFLVRSVRQFQGQL